MYYDSLLCRSVAPYEVLDDIQVQHEGTFGEPDEPGNRVVAVMGEAAKIELVTVEDRVSVDDIQVVRLSKLLDNSYYIAQDQLFRAS